MLLLHRNDAASREEEGSVSMMIILLLIVTLYTSCSAESTQLPYGNFAVPISQRPRPLFSFGQNIVEKGDLLGTEGMVYFQGKDRQEFVNALTLLYGFTDHFHAFISLPAPVFRFVEGVKRTKCGELFLQGEYQFFTRGTETSFLKATVFGSIFLPTGILVDPAPVNFSPLSLLYSFTSFLVGGTYAYTRPNWYGFLSIAELVPLKKDGVKLGNSFFLQSGWGHTFGMYDDRVIFLLLEAYYVHQNTNVISGSPAANSGGDSLFLGPSFWYSNDRLIVQLGIDLPVIQQLTGTQAKTSFVAMGQVVWKFL